jgi:hypothetical protein
VKNSAGNTAQEYKTQFRVISHVYRCRYVIKQRVNQPYVPLRKSFLFLNLTKILFAFRIITAGINTVMLRVLLLAGGIAKCPDFQHETTDSVRTTDTPNHIADRRTFCLQTDTSFGNVKMTGKV